MPRSLQKHVMPHYSLLVTSCDRFDLLKNTLDTFIGTNCGGLKPRECVIVDDSGAAMPDWLKEGLHYYSANLGTVRFVSNEARMGQIYTADRLWGLCQNEYAFWMEDDWQFNGGGDWMRESFSVLERYPDVIMVSLRGDSGWHQLIDDPKHEGVKIAMPGWKGGWGGFTFNCGARRKADYRKIGSYGIKVSYGTHLGMEMELSKLHLGMGYRIADLGRRIVEHTGGARSRATEPLPPMPKILIAIPAGHRLEYGKWESSESPRFDRANAWNGVPYGTDIHMSGENNRVAALRETWLKDVEKFKAFLEYKFFYGSPHDREPLADEVYIPCGDTYADLPAKTIEICKYAAARDYGYIFKCDDDTGVYIDRILQELMAHRPDYGGYLQGRVSTGGTGYWLSRRAFKIIAESATSKNHWAEDVTVGKCLFNHGIQPTHFEGHRIGREHWFYPNGYDPAVDMTGISSFHAMRPADLRAWYAGITHKALAA